MIKNRFVFRGILILYFTFFNLLFIFSQSSIQTFQTLPKLSIRGLEAISNDKAWFAANRGVWGYTENAGVTWYIDSIRIDTIVPEFRGISVLNDSTVLLMGIASPGFIFKTTNKGKTWKIVYRNDHKDFFLDCMMFKDSKNGIAIADPIDQSVQILRTKDSGNSWNIISQDSTPVFINSTAFFASSNTNIEWKKDLIWFCTGGDNADVWLNERNAITYDRYETPLPHGEIMTGIYSIDFLNSKLGVISGGDYDKVDTSITVLALTKDGGKNWEEIKLMRPLFGSCVQFLNKNEIYITGKPGTFKYNLKIKTLSEIKDSNGNILGFHTLRISPSKKVVWFAGSDGMIGRIKL